MPLDSLFNVGETVSHAVGLLETISEQLEAIRENGEPKPRQEIHARRTGSAVAPVSGIVDVPIGPPPQGWAWALERLATTAGAGGTLAVYLDSVDALNLVEIIDSPQEYADMIGGAIYVPPGRTVIFRFRGQPVTSICTIAVQARQFREQHEPQPAHIQ